VGIPIRGVAVVPGKAFCHDDGGESLLLNGKGQGSICLPPDPCVKEWGQIFILDFGLCNQILIPVSSGVRLAILQFLPV